MNIKTKIDRWFYRGNHRWFVKAGTVLVVSGTYVKTKDGRIIDHDDFLKACGENVMDFS